MGLFTGPKVAANPRCAVSLKEATDFLKRLKKAEQDLRALHKQTDATLAGCKDVCNAPLPHVYEETAAASGGAAKAIETIGGPGFSAEQISRFSVELGQAMESQVFAPLHQWISNHTDAVTKQKTVEKLWAEVDTRRGKVEDLRKKVDQLRAKQGDPKSATKLEEATKTLQHKEAKLTIAESRYAEEEEQQYNKLCILIKDAVYLRVFIKTALSQVAQALSSSSDSMLIFLPDQQAAAPAPAPAPVSAAPLPQQQPAVLPQTTTMPAHQQVQGEFQQLTLGHSPTMAAHTGAGGGYSQPAGGAATWGPGSNAAPMGALQRGTSTGAAPATAAYAAPSTLPTGQTFGRSRTMSGQ